MPRLYTWGPCHYWALWQALGVRERKQETLCYTLVSPLYLGKMLSSDFCYPTEGNEQILSKRPLWVAGERSIGNTSELLSVPAEHRRSWLTAMIEKASGALTKIPEEAIVERLS